MTDAAIDTRFLDVFPGYLTSLGADAAALGEVIASGGDDDVMRFVAAGLNYIFKSLDLIPDGIDDLGFMDDAFVLRVAASLATRSSSSPAGVPESSIMARLADESRDVRDFLGDDYARLEAYVRGLRKSAARGRTVDDILGDPSVRTTFAQEVQAWSKGYEVPSFTKDAKTLIKLRAFLNAKLS